MERIVHDLVQNSPEWHQFRLDHDGASEAAAMLGLSKNVSRSELLRAKHTGIAKEFSDWVQEHILDHGHAVEALARPLVEEMICEDLYPATYSLGRLSCSCDGLTMDGETAWEHKQWNAELAAAVARDELPDEYQPQCQQTMLVTGAKRVIFVCSDGTRDNFVSTEVYPNRAWQERIVAGWAQFHEDLANYQLVEVLPSVTAATIKELPALVVQVEGRVVSSNLVAFRNAASNFLAQIKTDLQTDQDFADAEKTVKFCKEGEDRLEVVKAQALAQTATIDELFRTVDEISGQLRAKRLALAKLVATRKESIRVEIVQAGKDSFASHIANLNKRLGKSYMPVVPTDFAGVIRGKKTVSSLRDAVDTELARAKIEANAIADRIHRNLNWFQEHARGYEFLFPDLAQLLVLE